MRKHRKIGFSLQISENRPSGRRRGADKAAALAVAEKMRKQIESADILLPSGEPGKKITVSLGIASFPDDGIGKFTDLPQKADERLYLAKTLGRNRVVC